MCQPLSAGGRRCAVHTHQATAFIRLASKISGLSKYQTERLFAELTREGRRAQIPEQNVQEATWTIGKTVAGLTDEGAKEKYEKDWELSKTHDRTIDGPAWYATQTIIERAGKRAEALNAIFQETANRTGLSVEEIKNLYVHHRDNTTRERGGEYPAEYNQNTRRKAVQANVPYDLASVVALEKIKNLETETRPRVTNFITVQPNTETVFGGITKIGYDNGRVELHRTRGREPLAYQNVPAELWDEIRTSGDSVKTCYSEVVGNSEYLYESKEDAQADSVVHRCASCGQFAAAGHSCPNRELRAKIAKTVPVEKVEEEFLKQMGEGYEAEPVEPAIVDETVAVEEPEPEVEPKPEKTVNQPVAAAGFTPVNIMEEAADPAVNPTEWAPPAGMEGHYFLNSEKAQTATVTGIPSTLEGQLSPQLLEYPKTVASGNNGGGGFHGTVYLDFDSSHHQYSKAVEANPLFAELVKNKPDYISLAISVGWNSENSSHTFEYLGATDTRYYTAYQNTWRGAVMGQRVVQDPNRQDSGDELQAELLKQEAETLLTRLRTQPDVVEVDRISSSTRRTIDPSLRQQPAANIGNIRQIKKALNENKAVIAPVVMEVGRTHTVHVDDQGFTSERGRGNVSGSLGFRRNADGAIEVLTSPRSLKCSCYAYRTKYYCYHISYAYRHFPNFVAQATTPTVQAVESSPEVALLGATLANRQDVTVTGLDTDTPVVSFGEEMNPDHYGRGASVEHMSDGRARIKLPENLQHLLNVPAGENALTFEDAKKLLDYRHIAGSLTRIVVPARMGEVRTALKKADVAVPVGVAFGGWQNRVKVKGAITYGKANTPGEAVIKGHTLKCSCPDYQEKYDCEHVRFLLGNNSLLLNARTRTVADPQGWAVINDRFNDEILTYNRVVSLMRASNLTREAAEEAIAEAERAEAERWREQARIREERHREYVRQAQARIEEERREAAIINKDTIAASEAYQADLISKWSTPDIEQNSYSANPSRFYQDYKEALARKRKGEEVIPYRFENVTDGIADPNTPGARAFGVELEFELNPPAGMSASQAREKIAEELYAKGLTSSPYQAHYHAGQNSGWEKWSYENDATVSGGELVSPLLYDTPEDWQQLNDALDILNKYGAASASTTGSHVHVSTASYGHSTAKNAQLLRDTNADEDMLYRLASSPERGRHRGTQWCGPNVDDNQGDISEDVLDGHAVLNPIRYNNHNIAVNFGGATNRAYKKNHVEFRHWDGTLDKGIIQQQVVVSLAMVDRAERTVIAEKGTSKKPKVKHKLGSNRAKEQDILNGERKQLTEEQFMEVNRPALDFIDSLVRKPEDKAGIASLFALTKWQAR